MKVAFHWPILIWGKIQQPMTFLQNSLLTYLIWVLKFTSIYLGQNSGTWTVYSYCHYHMSLVIDHTCNSPKSNSYVKLTNQRWGIRKHLQHWNFRVKLLLIRLKKKDIVRLSTYWAVPGHWIADCFTPKRFPIKIWQQRNKIYIHSLSIA